MKFQGLKVLLSLLSVIIVITGCTNGFPRLTLSRNLFVYHLPKHSKKTDLGYILERVKLRKNKYSTRANTQFLSAEINRAVQYLVNDFSSPLCLGDAFIKITTSPNRKAHFNMIGDRSLILGIFDLKRDKGVITHELFHAFYQNNSALQNTKLAEAWAMYSQLRYLHPNLSNHSIHSLLANKYRVTQEEEDFIRMSSDHSFHNRELRDYIVNALPLFNSPHKQNLAEYLRTYKGIRSRKCRKNPDK